MGIYLDKFCFVLLLLVLFCFAWDFMFSPRILLSNGTMKTKRKETLKETLLN